MVEEGKPAPDFELTSDSGETVKLSDLRGKQVVLYFYPKDDTPGCTTQACGIRDAYGEFEQAGAVVLGVSPDSEASHVKFKEKFGLPFALLADTDHSVSEAYDVWGEKKYMGRTYMGVSRSTFVIGEDGNVKTRDARRQAGHARRRRAGDAEELAQGDGRLVARRGIVVAELLAELGLELAALLELLDDVGAADELALDEDLRDRRPARDRRQVLRGSAGRAGRRRP